MEKYRSKIYFVNEYELFKTVFNEICTKIPFFITNINPHLTAIQK